MNGAPSFLIVGIPAPYDLVKAAVADGSSDGLVVSESVSIFFQRLGLATSSLSMQPLVHLELPCC